MSGRVGHLSPSVHGDPDPGWTVYANPSLMTVGTFNLDDKKIIRCNSVFANTVRPGSSVSVTLKRWKIDGFVPFLNEPHLSLWNPWMCVLSVDQWWVDALPLCLCLLLLCSHIVCLCMCTLLHDSVCRKHFLCSVTLSVQVFFFVNSCVSRQLAEAILSVWTDWRCGGPAGHQLSGPALLHTTEFKGQGGVFILFLFFLKRTITSVWLSLCLWLCVRVCASQVKFTSAVKLSEGGAAGPEYGRDEEENFFKRLGKWRSGRRNPSKLHHTEEKDGRPPPPQGAPSPTHPSIVFCLFLSLVVVSWPCLAPHSAVVVCWSFRTPSSHRRKASCYTVSAWMFHFQPIEMSHLKSTLHQITTQRWHFKARRCNMWHRRQHNNLYSYK